ncbi:MAG: YcgN family cysteine cluster protein [Gammaproteobacteria bacterium]|nr:YcgN family cysteine cluster protein [Gammaproteobacteria bacterium]
MKEVAGQFWKTKRLHELNQQEWELLCDGCAQCCRIKYCDENTEEISITPVACGLLDIPSCRCTSYENRLELVDSCVKITPENVGELHWLPTTCAYRLVAEGKDLLDWHPLVSGDRFQMDKQGISAKGHVVSERDVNPEDLEYRAVKWVR